MTRYCAFLIYGLIAVSPQAWAEFQSGNQLKAGLEHFEKGDGTVDGTYAAGYVIGVFDQLSSVRVCSPRSVTAGQVTDVVLKFMRQHPELLHFSGDSVVS